MITSINSLVFKIWLLLTTCKTVMNMVLTATSKFLYAWPINRQVQQLQTLHFIKPQTIGQLLRSFSTHSWKSYVPWTCLTVKHRGVSSFFSFGEGSCNRGLCKIVCGCMLISLFISFNFWICLAVNFLTLVFLEI